MDLKQFFKANPKAALAFSGGVDSAYLLYMAKQCRADVTAYFVKSAFQPAFELEIAKRFANELAVNLKIVELDILAVNEVAANDEKRCYYCKQALLGVLKEAAAKDGYSVMIDGTNATDLADERPGMKALAEAGVLSPLKLCGLGKDDIRAFSKAAGLFTWNRPAYACLATRIPTGKTIAAKDLIKIEKGEDELFRLGFSDFRIRLFQEAARVQMPIEQMNLAIEKRQAILSALKPYFNAVFLDLEGR